MFDKLTTCETAALLEEIRQACELQGLGDSIHSWHDPATLAGELHSLRLELREVFIRKFFEVTA